jgi:probable HAF family extracellular repeat protein
VTLNITILSSSGIHQSADFQLSDLAKDADGNWKMLEPNASKIVALRFRHWSGLLAYCGMGKWNGVRTDQYVSNWLSRIGNDATFDDVVEIVRKEGSLWIEKINRSMKKIEPHSFVLAGFENDYLRYAIVSNCQTLTGDISPPRNSLQAEARSTTGVHVFVTGLRDAVTEGDKRFLKHLARAGTDFGVIQHHLAAINRRAAQSKKAKKGISEPCLTYTCVPSGQQCSRVHGVVAAPVRPLAADGENMRAKMLNQFMRQHLPNATLVQGVYSTGKAQKSDIEEHIDCQLRFQSGFGEPDHPAIAEVQEFGSINEYALDVKVVNGSQAIVGNISVLPDATPRAFFSRDGEIVCLGSFSGALGYAHDLNESYQVVGRAGVDGGGMHAFIWSERDGLHDLGTLGGRSSHASSINDHGVVVGTSGCQPGEQKAGDERAFVWSQEHKMEALDAPEFDGWSRAFKVNNAGWVIGWRGRESVDCGYVWSREFEFIELRVGPGRPFFVCAINDSGLVVGEGDDKFGKRRPYCWTRDTGIRQLETNELFHPCSVDPRGVIIGDVWGGTCPWTRPFIYTPGHELLPLPYADDHHTSAAAINSCGTIVGSARRSGSWKHVHPIIWRLGM